MKSKITPNSYEFIELKVLNVRSLTLKAKYNHALDEMWKEDAETE